jgi:Tol biopolymer transport system component
MNRRMVVRQAHGIVVVCAVAAASTACQSQMTESPSEQPSARSPSAEPPAIATETASAIADLPEGSGRIMFGRRDPTLDDFVTYTVDPNGDGEAQLLPGAHQLGRWSPDANLISITAGDDSRVFAATIHPDGSGYTEHPITDPTLNLGCMLWSPDGKRLACEGWDDTDPARNGVYTINASDGSDLQRVTSSPDGNHDLPGAYAPDGRLLFARIAPDAEEGPLMYVEPGSEPQQLTAGTYGTPSLSADGETIVTDHSGALYLIPLDGGSSAPIQIGVGNAYAFGASWSPDDEWIVFSLNHDDNTDLYRVRPDGSDLFRITTDPAADEFADWAP